MAVVATPANLEPRAAATGMLLGSPLVFRWTPLVSGNPLTTVGLIVYSNSGGTTQVWASGDVEAVTGAQGDGWMLRWPADMGLASGTGYWWKVRADDDTDTVSAYSALTKLTMETDALTVAALRQSW